MHTSLKTFAAAVLFLAANNVANAQSRNSVETGTNASPLTKPSAPPASPYPDSGTEGGYLFNLRPLGLETGRALADHGIYITGRTLQQSISQLSGGIKQGTFYEGFSLLGVDIDLKKIAGINGASFHLLGSDLAGLPYSTYSGSLYSFNRAYALAAGARLNEFSYEQRLLDGRLDIRIGRVPTGIDFDGSQTYCEFITGVCAIPAGFTFDKGAAAYDTASTAAIVKMDLGRNLYANVAAFEDEPQLALVGHTNLPGSDWDPSKARGVTLPVQLGYKTTFANDTYPKSFDIGGFFDTGEYNDPFLNRTGQNRAIYGGTPKLDLGRSGVWLQAEQVIYRPDLNTRRALTVFADANLTTSGNPNINNAYFGGFSYKGPFASRPNDTFNGIVHVIHLNNAYTSYLDNLAALRGNGTVSASEAYFEFNYGIALAPGVVLKPSFTHVFNPDQVGIARPTLTNKYNNIFTLALSAILPDTLGLPRL